MISFDPKSQALREPMQAITRLEASIEQVFVSLLQTVSASAGALVGAVVGCCWASLHLLWLCSSSEGLRQLIYGDAPAGAKPLQQGWSRPASLSDQARHGCPPKRKVDVRVEARPQTLSEGLDRPKCESPRTPLIRPGPVSAIERRPLTQLTDLMSGNVAGKTSKF